MKWFVEEGCEFVVLFSAGLMKLGNSCDLRDNFAL